MADAAEKSMEYDDVAREVLAALHDKDTEAAMAALDRLMAIDPERAEGFFLLGLAALAFDEHGRALELIEKAAGIDPDCYEYAETLANLYTQVGRVEDGLYYAKLSTTLIPHPTIDGLLPENFDNYFSSLRSAMPSTSYLKGKPLYVARRFLEAVRHFDREARINPTHADCRRDLGDSLAELGRYSEALHHLAKAAELRPNDAETRFKLGNLCYRLGEFEEAVLQHKSALLNEPGSLELATAVLGWSANLPAGFGTAIEDFRASVNERLKDAPCLPPEAATFDDVPAGEAGARPKVRIGYLSNRFHYCDQARMVDSLFRLHNRAQFEVIMYQQSSADDSTTQRLRASADVTRFIGNLDDELVAVIIAGDEIDILVDLCMDDTGNRATLINMHPARLQVGAWGSNLGIAMPGIDVILTDEITDTATIAELPQNQRAQRLDFGLYSFEPREILPKVGPLPAERSGAPTIGIPCDPAAVTAEQAALLGKILKAAPNASVLLGATPYADQEASGRILHLLRNLGLADRAAVSTDQQYADQLIVDPNYWHNVDIFLDLGRRMSAATVADALWMGVPVLSVKGDRAIDMIGSSALNTAAKPQWMSDTPDALIAKAVTMLSDLPALAATRRNLRGEMRRALLFNPYPHVRALERTYLRLLGREAEIIE